MSFASLIEDTLIEGCGSDVDSGISHSPETVSNSSVTRDSEETDCAAFQSALLGSTEYEMYIQPDGNQGVPKPVETSADSPPRLQLSSENAILERFCNESKAPPLEYAAMCTTKKLKQAVDLRIKRRNANATTDYFVISPDANFEQKFTENYSILIDDKVPALRIYKILVNSAIAFFNKDPNTIEFSRVIKFFTESFLQSSSDVFEKIPDADRLLQELEVMTLIEIFTLTRVARPIAQTDVVKKLRRMSIFGSQMQRFLEDVLCDEFVLDLPLFMTQLLEELDVKLPLELKPYHNQEVLEGNEAVELKKPTAKPSKFDQLRALGSPEGAEEEESIVRRGIKREEDIETKFESSVRRSPRKSKPVVPFSPDKFFERTPVKVDPNLKRKYMVSETPEDKLIKKQCVEDAKTSLPNETVAQTPMEKFTKFRKTDSMQLTEQLIKTEATEKRRASKRLSFARSGWGTSQSASELQLPMSFPTSSQPGPSSSTASSSQRCTSRNLPLSQMSSTKSLTSVSSFESVVTVPLLTKRKSHPSEKITSAMNAAKVLTADILARYRQRMETVRSSSKRANPSEIFYGRSAGRPNLFASPILTTENPSDTTKQRLIANGQMNRSGRKVFRNCSSVYVAHTLLNTHNLTPLAPFKPPRDVDFKIQKLIRHASRKDWQRLQKFMVKKSRTSYSAESGDNLEATSSSAP